MTPLEIRRIVRIQDELRVIGSKKLAVPLTVSVAAAVIKNPFAGQSVEDVRALSEEYSPVLGEMLTAMAKEGLTGTPQVFGKAALVGLDGEAVHGSALIHTRAFGDALRTAAGGFSPVPSAEKVGAPGSTIDLSLRYVKESGTLESASVEHIFSYELRISNAPRPDEAVVISVLGDSHRPDWR